MISKLFNWDNQKGVLTILLDSLIIAGMVSFALFTNEIPDWANIWVVSKTFLVAFVTQIAFEMGIKPYFKKEDD